MIYNPLYCDGVHVVTCIVLRSDCSASPQNIPRSMHALFVSNPSTLVSNSQFLSILAEILKPVKTPFTVDKVLDECNSLKGCMVILHFLLRFSFTMLESVITRYSAASTDPIRRLASASTSYYNYNI